MKAILSTLMITCLLTTGFHGNIWNTDFGKEVRSKTDFTENFSSIKPPEAKFKEIVDSIDPESGHTLNVKQDIEDINYNAWYTTMNDIKAAEEPETIQISDITAYTTPPWNSTNDTYFFYQQKAKMDLYDFLTSSDIQAARGNQSAREFIEDKYLSYMNGWDHTGHRVIEDFTPNKTAYCTVDGVQCVFCGPPPAAVYRDYIPSGNWKKTSYPGASWEGSTKMCLVLVPKGKDREDPSNYIYLPAVSGSAKAHTFPWGVTQTHVSVKSENDAYAYTAAQGDYGKHYHFDDISSVDSIRYIAQTYDDGRGHHMLDFLYCGVELCYPGTELFNALNDKYSFVGYLVYK